MIRDKNDLPLKAVLKQFANNRKFKAKLTKTKVVALWGNVMGPTIAQYTKKIDLVKGTLYITIESAALRQELSYGKSKIQKMMNEELGETAISEVIIR